MISFANYLNSYADLGIMPTEAKCYTCTYIEDEAPGAILTECCFHDTTGLEITTVGH